MIGTLAELAAMPGMPSEPTLRKLIDAHDDFPLISRGKNGVGYEIDLEAAAKWWRARTEREQAEARERAEAVRQLGFDLLGGDAVAPVAEGLTAAERRALIDEEFAATRLAQLRGELVRRAEVESAVSDFVAFAAERAESLPQRLVRRAGSVPREVLAELQELIRADRIAVADRMTEIAEAAAHVPVERDAAAADDSALCEGGGSGGGSGRPAVSPESEPDG